MRCSDNGHDVLPELLSEIECCGSPNGRRYRQVRDVADKATRRSTAIGTVSPKVRATPRTCPVHAVLGALVLPYSTS